MPADTPLGSARFGIEIDGNGAVEGQLIPAFAGAFATR